MTITKNLKDIRNYITSLCARSYDKQIQHPPAFFLCTALKDDQPHHYAIAQFLMRKLTPESSYDGIDYFVVLEKKDIIACQFRYVTNQYGHNTVEERFIGPADYDCKDMKNNPYRALNYPFALTGEEKQKIIETIVEKEKIYHK